MAGLVSKTHWSGENVAGIAPLFINVSQGPSCSTDLDLAHINMVGVA